MVATSACAAKSMLTSGKKVSKPLMEKKRRARINKCLDQLKSLLESYYSSSIRKRKLEKADILELTVKHLGNLQKIHNCATVAAELSEHHAGFRSCLTNVNQYLLMSDLTGSDRWMLSQLCAKLRRSSSSTTDSAAGTADPRSLHPSAVKCRPAEAHTSHFCAEENPGNKERVLDVSQNTREEKYSKFDSVSLCNNEAGNLQNDVWRPW
ncbi:hairy-related 3 [Thalassophryne amazonica]|uniref:hairy-related 3 n=1 Tax=Thalassophryne amazonica TaxID=390379 RepID=UPI0014724B75|nr:hairy-related 3 [Thalassophryne amazonica]